MSSVSWHLFKTLWEFFTGLSGYPACWRIMPTALKIDESGSKKLWYFTSWEFKWVFLPCSGQIRTVFYYHFNVCLSSLILIYLWFLYSQATVNNVRDTTAVQVATKCLLLQSPIVISWCFMRIIHSCLVHGRGVVVFHIVESLVFSAHIMK